MEHGFQFSRNDNPRPRARVVPIRQIQAIDQLQLVVLSHSIWGIDVHWSLGRILPHVTDSKLCQHCLARAPLKWRGYLHVVNPKNDDQFFLELTDYAYKGFLKATQAFESKRGLICLFARERKTLKAPVATSFVSDAYVGKSLPASQTPEQTLKVIWKIFD